MKLSSRALVPVLAAMLLVGGVVAAKTGYGKETEVKRKAPPAIREQPKSTTAAQKGHLLAFLFSWLAVRSGTVPGPLSRAPGQADKKNSAGKAVAADKLAERAGHSKAIPEGTSE